MAIGYIYLGAGFVLFVLVQSLTPVAITFDIWLNWLPFGLDILVGLILGILIYANGIVWTAAIAVAAIHTIWILTGAWSLSQSVKKTWTELRKDDFFEEDEPRWLIAGLQGVEQVPAIQNQQQSNIGVVFKSGTGHLYRDLNHKRGEIRLLKRTPDAVPEGTLCFELVHQALIEDTRSYTALSYCWGSGEPTETIFIKPPSGEFVEVRIRANLYSALRRVKDYKHERLWVDALCINQTDGRERDRQVTRMRSIFATATNVLAWVPNEEENSEQQHRNFNGSFSITPSINHGNHTQSENERGVHDLLENPYWRRMWIVQEFALAQEIQVLTRNDIVIEDQLQDLLKTAFTNRGKHGLERANNVMEIRSRCKRDTDPSLIELLLRTSASFSEYRHDRVFGILSLANDGEKFLTEPSYEMSVEQLSMIMTRRYLRTRRDSYLDIILLGACSADESNLPSWCPHYFSFDLLPDDHRLFEYVQHIFGRGQSTHRRLFRATEGSMCKVNFKTDSLKVLCCLAFPLGTISSLGWISSDLTRNDFPSDQSLNLFDATAEEVATGLWNLLSTLLQRDYQDRRPDQDSSMVTDETTDADYKRCTYAYIYFMLLVFGGGGMHVEEAEAGASDGWYAQWLSTNQRFMFGQRTLHEHAKSMGLMLKRGNFWKWAESVMDTLKASTIHKELRDWRRIHKPLKTVAKQHMRLMTLATDVKGVIGLAHSAARQKDEVFLLSGCSVPVILRKTPGSHQYFVVGDAIVPGAMFGEKWQGHDREVEIV